MIQLNPHNRVAFDQLIAIGIVAGFFVVNRQLNDALTLLLGGLIAITAQLWFAYRTLSDRRVKASAEIVAVTSRAVLEKYGFSAVGFAAVFGLYQPEGPIYVFCGYLIALCIQLYAVGKQSQQTKL